MKCKRHPYEFGVGVCASCLRERLLDLITTQGGRSPELRRNLDSPPPPLAFPRSVSPYVSHRRSVGSGPSASRPHCRFFSTPQVGPFANSERIEVVSFNRSSSCTKSTKKFSLLSALFGYPRSGDVESSRSTSWLSGLFSGRRKKKSERRSQPRSKSFHERGMSPDDDSACSSGYSTESSTGWRRPEPTPVRKYPSSASKHGRAVSGFAFCLSPLVRPSPKPASDLGISGDPRGGFSHHHHHRRHVLAGGSSLAPNRSKKLADHGRYR